MSNSSLTWLHLADLHCCAQRTGWDADRILRALRKDLKQLREEHGLHPDLLLFTGDIAFGQLADHPISTQYEEATLFFEEIREFYDLPSERVFLVPGNHDINRDAILASQTAWLAQNSREDIIELISGRGKEWRRIMERLADYRAFLDRAGYKHLLTDPDRLVYARRLEIGHLTVGIAGLDSAWSCTGDDRGNLWLGGEWQLATVERELAGSLVCIGLIHHPLSWCRSAEGTEELEPYFARVFDFHLHGHEHEPWVHPLDGGTVRIAAGAVYDRKRRGRPPGYNLVQLDFGSARGEVWMRQYQEPTASWIPYHIAGKTDHRGVWQLDKLRCLSHTAATDSLPPSERVEVSCTPELSPDPDTPEGRGIYGRAQTLQKLAELVEERPINAVFGLSGVGKSTLIKEVRRHRLHKGRRAVHLLARKGEGFDELFPQIASVLGCPEADPPLLGIGGRLNLNLLQKWARKAKPSLIHLERAELLLDASGAFLDSRLDQLLRAIAGKVPTARVVLESARKLREDLLPKAIFAVRRINGISRDGVAAFFRRPWPMQPELGWSLTDTDINLLYSRLGGGVRKTDEAHALAMVLLANVAEGLQLSPTEVLGSYSVLYDRKLDIRLFDVLYQDGLGHDERRMLDLCALYRIAIPLGHAEQLVQHAGIDSKVLGELERRCLLSRVGGDHAIHSVIADRTRAHRGEKSQEVLDDHDFLAKVWMGRVQHRRRLGLDEIRAAQEVFYHLEQAESFERFWELKDVLSRGDIRTRLESVQQRLYQEQRLEESRTVLELWVELDKNNPKAHRLLGESLVRIEGWRFGASLKHLETAVQLQPLHGGSAASYGRALRAQGRARHFLEHIDRLEPLSRQRLLRNDKVVVVYCHCLEAEGRMEDAAANRRRRIGEGSTYPPIYRELAQRLMADSRSEEALKILEKARRARVENEFTISARAKVLDRLGATSEAAEIRRGRIAEGSSYPAFFHDLAGSLLASQQPAEALKVLDQANERGADFKTILRAEILDALGRTAEAQEVRRERIDPGAQNPDYYLDEAKRLLAEDRPQKALDILDQARPAGSENDLTATLRRKIIAEFNNRHGTDGVAFAGPLLAPATDERS